MSILSSRLDSDGKDQRELGAKEPVEKMAVLLQKEEENGITHDTLGSM